MRLGVLCITYSFTIYKERTKSKLYPSLPSQDVLVGQLMNRYHKRRIYTYVGDILVSVNPFQNLSIYNDKVQFS